MGNVNLRASVIIGDHQQATGHRFQRYIAKGLSLTGEEEYVRRSVMCGKTLADMSSGENHAGMLSLQSAAEGAVANDNEFDSAVNAFHRIVSFYSEVQVLFGRQTSHIHQG